MNVAQGRAAEAHGCRHVRKAALHEHHVRSGDGDVRACADGDADVGAGQGGRVVDAVADHGHDALFLEPADHGLLAVGTHAGNDLVHAGLGGNGSGRPFVVAREHDGVEAHVLEFLHGAGAVFLDDVGHGHKPEKAPVPGKAERGLALAGKLFGTAPRTVGKGAGRGNEGKASAGKRASPELRPQPQARQSLEVLHLGRHQPPSLGQSCDSLGQGMFGATLQGRGQREEFLLRNALCRQNVRCGRFAAGDGARLVEDDDLRLAGLFERDGRLEEHAVSGAKAAAHHDGDRRGEAEGAGTADDENRDAPGQGEGEILAGGKPACRRHGGNGDDGGHEDAGDAVCDLGNGGLGGRGVAHHLDDLGKGRVFADALSPAAQEARLVDGGSRNGIARRLVHGNALARQGRLVDGAGALLDDAVHGNAGAGTHDEDVAHPHLLHGDLGFPSVPDDEGPAGRQGHEALEGAGGLALAARLEHLPHGDEREDHGRRLEVEVVQPFCGEGSAAVRLRPGHGEEHKGAPAEGGGRSQGHERVHVGGALERALEADGKELAVDDHDGRCQEQLEQAQCRGVAVEEGGQGPAQHHVPHGAVHERSKIGEGPGKAPLEDRGFAVGEGIVGALGLPLRPGTLGRSAVAGVRNRLDDGSRACRALHAERIRQQAHRAAGHAGHGRNGPLHPGLAGSAAHARHCKLFHADSLACATACGRLDAPPLRLVRQRAWIVKKLENEFRFKARAPAGATPGADSGADRSQKPEGPASPGQEPGKPVRQKASGACRSRRRAPWRGSARQCRR